MPNDDWGPAESLRDVAKRVSDIYDRITGNTRAAATPTPRTDADSRANQEYRAQMLRDANNSYRADANVRTQPSTRTTTTRTSNNRRGSRSR